MNTACFLSLQSGEACDLPEVLKIRNRHRDADLSGTVTVVLALAVSKILDRGAGTGCIRLLADSYSGLLDRVALRSLGPPCAVALPADTSDEKHECKDGAELRRSGLLL